jgi:hypothetical protein
VSKTIGNASDFYRLRVVHVDETEGLDLDWRDDILYRRPPEQALEENEVYRVEAVLLDDENVSVSLKNFGDAPTAHEWLETISEDLGEMTKSEFEESYFPG